MQHINILSLPLSRLVYAPARLCTRILKGEYIDFNSLLPYAMFSVRDGLSFQHSSSQTFTIEMSTQSGELQLAPTPAHTRKINSFGLWMAAWNVYASTLLSAKPSWALELFGYQRIIASANLTMSLNAWMTYDIKFCTLAASCSTLPWDLGHVELYVECLSIPKQLPERWPCPHCGSMYHFLERCPFRASASLSPSVRQLPITGTHPNTLQMSQAISPTPHTNNPTTYHLQIQMC